MESKVKKKRKMQIFIHLNKDISSYKGLPIENTIGSCYLQGKYPKCNTQILLKLWLLIEPSPR